MPLPDDLIASRKRVAARYLTGNGIEIGALAAMCTETKELGYDMLWQGEPETP